jgi:plasmid stabilization system protein ParE
MTFKVKISILARDDIARTAAYIRLKSGSERADLWKKGLLETIKTFKEMPLRCSVAGESHDIGIEVREWHYYSHRIIFSVVENSRTIQILRIFHSARADLRVEDIP